MNWVGDLIQKNIKENETVLDLGCGIMQNLLDVVESYPKTRLKCKYLHGVDIYEPYLEFLNEKGISTTKWDLRKIPLPFKDKSFDNVLLCDILEHFDKYEHVENILKEAERIARKRIFVLTPKIFVNNLKAIFNPYPYDHIEGVNKYQKHHLLISLKYLKNKKYRIIRTKYKKHIFAIKKVYLKILHIWETAGVAGVMAKYQRKLGNEVKCLMNIKFDPYRFRDVYKYDHYLQIYNRRFFWLINKFIEYIYLIIYVFLYNPNFIHIHNREFYPFIFPFRKKLVEFHGTNIRNKLADNTINKYKKVSSRIFKIYERYKIPYFISTKDLFRDIPNKSKDILINNPVDTDLFNKEHHNPIHYGKYFLGLYSLNHYEYNLERIKKIEETIINLKIYILNRRDGNYVVYKHFSKFLSKFEYYIDRYNIESLSKTALEALSMGLKVIRYDNKIIEGLPELNNPYVVAKNTIKIYNKIINGEYNEVK